MVKTKNKMLAIVLSLVLMLGAGIMLLVGSSPSTQITSVSAEGEAYLHYQFLDYAVATDGTTTLSSKKSSLKSITFTNTIDESLKTDANFTFNVGQATVDNESTEASTFTESVTAYLKGTELIVYSANTIYAPQNSENLFSVYYVENYNKKSNLQTITFNNFNTSLTTNMSNIFYYCKALTSLDLSSFNTSQVTNMSTMFSSCSALTSLDLSSFDASQVTNMSGMFSYCLKLTSLNLSNFDTSQVIDMSSMFYRCEFLRSLDVTNFNTSQVTNMSDMFSCCSALTSLDVTKLNTSQVTNMSSMFSSLSLTSLDVTKLNTSQVTNMSCMFANCKALTSLDLSSFDTSQVTDMGAMFDGCSSLTSLDLSNFNTSQVTDMGFMFRKCSLTSLDLSNFNTSQVTDMGGIFSNCSALNSLDVSNFDTSQVTDMSSMFSSCSALTSLDVSNFDTSQVTKMSSMFSNCSALTSLDLSNFNTSLVTDMSAMFKSCSGLTSLNLSTWDMSNVTTTTNWLYGGMLGNCVNLSKINLPSTVERMTTQTIALPEISSITITGADHYALTGTPGEAITEISTAIYGIIAENPVIELYDSTNNSLEPVERTEIEGIVVTNGKAYEYTENTTDYKTAIEGLTGTVAKVNDAIGVFDLEATGGQEVTLKVTTTKDINKDNVHVMHYNGSAWEDVTNKANITYADNELTIVMTLDSYSPVAIVEATPAATPSTPETGVELNTALIIVPMLALLGLAVVLTKKKQRV